jgi:hypothetical protein
MADIGEERRLDPVDLGERLGPLALLFVGARVGDGSRDLGGGELIKALVLFIEFQS